MYDFVDSEAPGFSVTFDDGNDTANTWDDWELIMEAPPIIPPPEPVTNYVDIPGRRKGPLDLSMVPFGKMIYRRITGSWSFVRDIHETGTRNRIYELMRRFLHGKVMKVITSEDSTRYFKGRITVGPPSTGHGPTRFQIAFDLEPVRYKVSDDSVDGNSYVYVKDSD